MKCTNCGKNNAVNHYRYEVNGKVAEAHLCPECARKLQPERELAARSRELFGGMPGGGFFGGGLLGGLPVSRPLGGLLDSFFGEDPFMGFPFASFAPFAPLGAPRIEISFPEAWTSSASGETAAAEQDAVDPELAQRREANALREQLRAAVESEDYEKAAQLRDKLRMLENSGNEKKD